ncbi:MAG: N-6 DNA methylase [Acidimicrobiales bacterium]|nr:N-6 DNA methylase [Acidimicrobiales bacterium]
MSGVRPDINWLNYAAAVGVDGIAGLVLDACANEGGVAAASHQGVLLPEPTGGWANPRLLGWVHEWMTSASDRDDRGAYYTPPDFAADVVDAALRPAAGSAFGIPAFTVDPACGGGVFLLEVLDRLVSSGVDPGPAVGAVAGLEIDPGAARAARLAIQAWQLLHGLYPVRPPQIVVADALGGWPRSWPEPQLVVGNPPFASPMKSGSVPAEAASYRNHHSEVLGPYADLAAIHLWRASQALADGGRLAFVAPVSIINARDTGLLWKRLETQADAVRVLIPASNPFEASVQVFVPVLEMRREARSNRRSLAAAVGDAIGIPPVEVPLETPTLVTIANATSGFRDEFYGLAEFASEETQSNSAQPLRKLVNVGSIDPLHCSWGQTPARFAKERWERPVVDASKLTGKVGAFVDRQNRPKVLVATQSSILEPVVDPVGDLVGITPTLIVTTDRPSHVAAMLLAPPVVAIAAQRWYGTGLTATALRPTASTLVELPLPLDQELWDQAAALVDRNTDPVDGHQSAPSAATLLEIAELMNRAYGADADVLRWWLERARLTEA